MPGGAIASQETAASILIGDRRVGAGEPVLLIAEIGVNHNGKVELAKKLVAAAAAAGADAVKFQTYTADRVALADARKASYQLETTEPGETQLEMLRRFELSAEAHRDVVDFCRELGILFISTAADFDSADLLEALDVPAFKIGSGEVTNWPLLRYVARKGKPVILSTGMSYLDEVRAAVEVITATGNRDLVVLHCVSNYPADPSDANVRAIPALGSALGFPVGYSNHVLTPESALAAVALGACLIETHFTLDTSLEGPDHRASLDPEAFRALVSSIRTLERTLGDGEKRPVAAELENRELVRRSLVSAREIPAGSTIDSDMLSALRPGTGISPARADEVVGRRVLRSLAKDEPIRWDDLE